MESPSRSTVARRAAALLAAKETRFRDAEAAFKGRMQVFYHSKGVAAIPSSTYVPHMHLGSHAMHTWNVPMNLLHLHPLTLTYIMYDYMPLEAPIPMQPSMFSNSQTEAFLLKTLE